SAAPDPPFSAYIRGRSTSAAYNFQRPMTTSRTYTATVKAEGHLIDSQLLNAIFDVVIERGGAFEVQHFDIGRTNDDFSRLTLKVSTENQPSLDRLVEALIPLGCHVAEEEDARLRPSEADGTVPDDFYSTTNQRTQVRVDGAWIDVEHQRMDAAIVVSGRTAGCRKLRDVRAGDRIVCGLGGLRVTPEFRDRERADFAFMSNEV